MTATHLDLSVPIWTIKHVAAALGDLSIDTAREHTYRSDFPAAKEPFAANLWLREDVLAWFAALPARTANRADRSAPRRATGPRPRTTATPPAAARTAPPAPPLAAPPASPTTGRRSRYTPRAAA